MSKERKVINELAEHSAMELGYVICNISLIKNDDRKILRITIKKDGFINLNDCERFSRHLEKKLDETDALHDPYFLEVASPGIKI